MDSTAGLSTCPTSASRPRYALSDSEWKPSLPVRFGIIRAPPTGAYRLTLNELSYEPQLLVVTPLRELPA